jgi:type IV pilus assembly protein PilC
MQKYKYVAVDIKETPISSKPPSAFFSVSGKVNPKELTTFCRQFAIMINSGISIVESLSILRDQSYSDFFKKVIGTVFDDVKVGLLLSEAMSKHKKVFPPFFTSMTYVGEQSGMLDEVLCSIADYYETDAKIRNKTKSAMIYPMFLAILMLAIVILMVAFVIPTFENSLAELDVEMPLLTMTIMGISHWFIANWKYVVLTVVALVVILIIVGKTPNGEYFYHTLLLHLPLIGKVQIALISAKFARGFGLLLSSGMDIVDAMSVISAVLGNKNVEKRFNLATDDVREGQSITTAMTKYNLFPTILIQMVSVGEKTGSVDKVLLQSSSYFDNQAEKMLTGMTTLIQPIMLGVMGLIVGFLFYAIYSPMIAIMQTL